MRLKLQLFLTIIAMIVAIPQDSMAQEQSRREGFWFNAGLGYGALGCQDCGDRTGGLSGGLALGGTISQNVSVGVGTNGWTKSEGGATVTVGTLTALLRWYPSSTGDFFILAGLGVGSVDASLSGVGSARANGAGAVLGLGYDIRVGGNVSLTPFWNGAAMSNSDGDANFGQIGIGLTVH